ncbi:MAG: response regulator [Hahellaceae bacterium]|nr:response regulator [Hahellaceae bacterium]
MTKKVLIIDDDKIVRKYLDKHLSDEFEVHLAETGEKGLEVVEHIMPDVILLDVQMPGLNGYEVCDQLKHNPGTAEVPVIFLSGRSSVRERMLGYEVGADDYIVKPCEPEELKAKMNVLIKFVGQQASLQNAYKQAKDTAIVAMAGSSELGHALGFTQQSFTIRSYSVLAGRFFSVCQSFGLSCCLLFHTKQGDMFFSSKGEIKPLEKELMGLLRSEQRISDFGSRTQFNFSRTALLVKNMPLDDRDRYGRYKDLFPFMLEAVDAKLHQLDAEHALINQTKSLLMSFMSIKSVMDGLARRVQSQQGEGQGTHAGTGRNLAQDGAGRGSGTVSDQACRPGGS